MRDERYRKQKDIGEQLLDRLGESISESIQEMDFSGLSESIQASVDYIREEAERGYANYRETLQKQLEAEKARKKALIDERRNHKDGEHRYTIREKNGEGSLKKPAPVIRNIPGKVQGPLEMGLGAIATIIFGCSSVAAGLGSIFFSVSPALLGVYLGLTGLGGALFGHGWFAQKRGKRMQSYDKFLRGKDYAMLDKLQEACGGDLKQIRKDIHYLLDHKLAPSLTMDKEETCLMMTDEVREQYAMAEQAREEREKELQQQKEAEALLEKKKREGTKQEREWIEFQEASKAFLENLEQKKQEITTKEMLVHMEAVEVLLSQIFLCIKEHPEMILSTGHLISYYLPCMSKLINTYEDLEDQPIQGENILRTKKEIEDSFTTIESALENMYDELFRNVSMDISSDIQVLKAMMAQDGWSE